MIRPAAKRPLLAVFIILTLVCFGYYFFGGKDNSSNPTPEFSAQQNEEHGFLQRMESFEKNPWNEIPRKIHQVWVGDVDEAPCGVMDSFRTKFLAQNPSWTYHFWTVDKYERKYGPMRNQEAFGKETSVQSKSDMLRYEVLMHEGGIYIDANMLWLEGRSFDYLISQCAVTGTCLGKRSGKEDQVSDRIKKFPLYDNSFIVTAARNPGMAHVVWMLGQNIDDMLARNITDYVRTGSHFFSHALQLVGTPITPISTDVFFPVGWSGHLTGAKSSAEFDTAINNVKMAFDQSIVFEVDASTAGNLQEGSYLKASCEPYHKLEFVGDVLP